MSTPPAGPIPSSSRARGDISPSPLSQDNDLQSTSSDQQQSHPGPALRSPPSPKSTTSTSSLKGKEKANWVQEEEGEPGQGMGSALAGHTVTQSKHQPTQSKSTSAWTNLNSVADGPLASSNRSAQAELAPPPRAHTNKSPPNSPLSTPQLDKQPATLSFAIPEPTQPHPTPRQQTQLFSIASGSEPGAAVSAGPLETRGLTTGGGAGTNWTTRSWKASTIGGYDKKRLQALGFDEELTRKYDFFASTGIGLCNIGAFNGVVGGLLTAIETGGSSMYCWSWPISGLFLCALAAVLAEMASTWPVAGANFTWVFRLCRSSRRLDPFARYFSWVIGSFLLCYHILLQIVIAYQLAHAVEGIHTLYTGVQWSTWTQLGACWAGQVVVGVVVSSPLSMSPWVWRASGFFVIASVVITNVVLLTKTNYIRPAHYVFFNYENTADPGQSKSYVYLIGWALTSVATGLEACAHIAEDTKRPSRTVPLAMFWSTALSYIMGWVSICVLVATTNTMGINLDLQPSVGLLINSLPRPYVTLILVLVLCCLGLQNVAQLLATSRFIFALARESALPFSGFFRRLSTSQRQPLNAIWATVAVVAPGLLLLRISPSVVGTILLEGAAWTVSFAYAVPVALYLACPADALLGDGRAKWSLRKWSKPLGACAVFFFSVFLVVLCFPTQAPVTPLTASYASVIGAGTLLFSSVAWLFYGNRNYSGPIRTTTKYTLGAEIELPHSGSQKTSSGQHPVQTRPVGSSGATTSAGLGRSAHQYSNFPSLNTNQGPPSESGWYGTEGTGTWQSEWTSEEGSHQGRSRAREEDEEEGVRGREHSRSGRTSRAESR